MRIEASLLQHVRNRWRAARARWFVASLRWVDSPRARLALAIILFPCMPYYAKWRYDDGPRFVIPRGECGDMNLREENYYPRCASECAKPHYSHGCECQRARGRERTHNFDVGGEG